MMKLCFPMSVGTLLENAKHRVDCHRPIGVRDGTVMPPVLTEDQARSNVFPARTMVSPLRR
jgi:hypothetical protein